MKKLTIDHSDGKVIGVTRVAAHLTILPLYTVGRPIAETIGLAFRGPFLPHIDIFKIEMTGEEARKLGQDLLDAVELVHKRSQRRPLVRERP